MDNKSLIHVMDCHCSAHMMQTLPAIQELYPMVLSAQVKV